MDGAGDADGDANDADEEEVALPQWHLGHSGIALQGGAASLGPGRMFNKI